jgi:pSer/pThr/pTyr-binding forkhead associated (FHA) protein
MILRSGTMPWLYDLGSANGTSVNGVALGDHPAALHPGDAITFGPVTFTFRLV